MNARECGYLLLSSKLGDPDRRPLSTPQLRLLAQKASYLSDGCMDADLTAEHLIAAGVDKGLALRTVNLLSDELQLKAYLRRAKRLGLCAITRASEVYPPLLRMRLGQEAPGCLWAKGNLDILSMPAVSLVGSRDLRDKNRKFAQQVGILAAQQGYALVSGNARGADSAAQAACLEAGGFVISVIADSLEEHCPGGRVLLLSEDDFDEPFTVQRALHRNRVIHALGDAVFVAQCTLSKGGTWDGSTQNLRRHWSDLYCFKDGSPASVELEQMGACLIEAEELHDFKSLPHSSAELGMI